jgi:hypothetical protein
MSILSYPKFKAFDYSSGAPLAGGLVYTYESYTNTPAVTFSDPGLLTQNTNPVVLDSNGEAWIFAAGETTYRVDLFSSTGVLMWSNQALDFATIPQGSISGHNLLMNGGFEVNQPAVGGFVGAGNQQLVDGWAERITGGTANNYTFSVITSGYPESKTALRIQRNAASVSFSTIFLVQNIETLDAVATQIQSVCLSFVARIGANFTGVVVAPSIVIGTGTDEAWQTSGTLTGPTIYTMNTISAPTLTTSWQQYSYIAGPLSSVTNELSLLFSIAAFGLGTAGLADYIDVDNFQLELGTEVTNFEREPFDAALRRCQRRYYKSFPYTQPPINVAGTPGAFIFPNVVGAATAQTTPSLPAPGWMRDVAGTITTYNPSAANAQARNTTVAADCTNTTGVISSNEAHITVTTAAGSAAGNVNAVHYLIDKRI